jgi:4-hydroxybenzoate polyprenyltransferase
MDTLLTFQYYKPLSYSFIKAYALTMRPYLMFVSGITGIAGMAFAETAAGAKLIMIFAASFLSYGFGQALTDCFQIDTDTISSPYRPLTQKVVSKTAFIITSITGLIFCVGVLSLYNPLNILLGLAAGAGLATYTYFKRKWWGGPFYNAWIVTVLFFMGFLAASNEITTQLIFPAAAVVFFGYSNFVLSGYFKDIEADRTTGYNTLPVKYGRKISSVVSDLFAAAALFLTIYVIFNNPEHLINNYGSLGFFIAGTFLAIYAQIKLHKVRKDDEAFKAISPVVHSYILLLSSIIISLKQEWFIPLIIYYSAYLIILKIRPSKAQI